MKTSRDPLMLYSPLRQRWDWLRDEWAIRYPYFPQPFLTCTHRSDEDQQAAYAEGKSLALPGESLHNYLPALAFDIGFKLPNGDVTWDMRYFRLFAEMAKTLGLEWGGDWKGLVDGPHFQMPMTWEMAQRETIPGLPSLPKHSLWALPRPGLEPEKAVPEDENNDLGHGKVVLITATGEQHVANIPQGYDVVTRYDARRQRYYVVIREGEQ